MAELTFLQKLAHNEVPRRILGAVLSVPAPGAGHVVIGHPKIGALIAGVSFTLWGLATLGGVLVMPALFLIACALWVLVTVGSVVSMFALPPGPTLKTGLRGLWPALALFLVSRGLLYLIGNFGIGVAPATDDSLAPDVRKGDTLLVHPGAAASAGDVVLFARPDDKLDFRRMDVSTPTDRVRGRALFVFASGAGDGRGRIWKPLRK